MKKKVSEVLKNYPPYSGEEPYLYLSFSETCSDEMCGFITILNTLGFHVSYDPDVFNAVTWKWERAYAIEKCAVFVDFHLPRESVSHIEKLGTGLSEMLHKPYIYVNGYDEYADAYKGSAGTVSGHPKDKDIGEKFLAALESQNFRPGISQSEWEAIDPARHYDLDTTDIFFTYYKEFGDNKRVLPLTRIYFCNLRTREIYDNKKYRIDDIRAHYIIHGHWVEDYNLGPMHMNDEDLYAALMYKYYSLVSGERSDEPDYELTERDCSFAKIIKKMDGKAIPEFQQKYLEAKKRLEESYDNYPKMDEFEYIDAKITGEK